MQLKVFWRSFRLRIVATLTKVRRLGVAGSSANPTQAPSETTPQSALQWNPSSDARVGNQSDPQATSSDQTYGDRIGPRLNESKLRRRMIEEVTAKR